MTSHTLPVSVFSAQGDAVSQTGSKGPIPNKPQEGIPTGQPVDGKEAKRMVAEEKEEEILDKEGMGLTIPPGGPRPALIIVMVSRGAESMIIGTVVTLIV